MISAWENSQRAEAHLWQSLVVAITCGGTVVSYLELKTICDVTDPQLRRNFNATLLRCFSEDGLWPASRDGD